MATTCTVDDAFNISAGDAVCVVGWDNGFNRPKVARASRARLATSKTVFGIAKTSEVDTDPIDILVAGEAAVATLTGLNVGAGAGTSRIIATDINQTDADPATEAALQCRLIRVDRPNGSEHVVGTCDESGNLAVVPRASRETSAEHAFNVRAYGAVPTAIGAHTDADDCTQAFLDAIAACSLANSSTNLHGSVWVPPCDPGFEYYLKGKTNDSCPMLHIEISRTVRISGVGTGRSGVGGSRIKLGPLCAGFRFVTETSSSDGGEGSASVVEGLDIYCTPLDELDDDVETEIVFGWESEHDYEVGDKIQPHRFHNLYYECIKAGESGGPTPAIGDCSKFATTAVPEAGNRWRPGKEYELGDKIYPNDPCGKTFVCTAAGKTVGDVDANGEGVTEGLPGAGEVESIGEPDWYGDLGDPRGSVYASIVEAGNGPTWEPDEDDPEPIWELDAPGNGPCLAQPYQTNHLYGNGAQVFAEDRFDVIFVAKIADVHTKEMSGGGEPALFATKMPGESPVADGDILWYPIVPIGVVADGEVVWAARFAGAFLVNAAHCEINRCFVQGAATAAIGVFSLYLEGVVSMFADLTQVIGPSMLFLNRVGIYTKGGDTNGGCFSRIFVLGSSERWLDPAEHAVYDNSFGGNRYIDCAVQPCSGYAFGCMGGAASNTLSHLYIESAARKSPLRGSSQVFGGTVTASHFRLDTQDANGALSPGAAPSFFSDGITNLFARSRSNSVYGVVVESTLKGDRDAVLFWRAKNELDQGTNDDVPGYQLRWADFAGWWTIMHRNSYPALSFSGASSPFKPGLVWLHRGFLVGTAHQHVHFGDDAASRDSAIAAHARLRGDIVDRSNRAALGNYYHRVNVNPNGGAYANPWEADHEYALGDIVVPTEANVTPNRRAFQVVDFDGAPPFKSDVAEPAWADVLDEEMDPDGGIIWKCIEGADFRYSGLIEDGAVGRRIQPVTVWADSGDTDQRYEQPEVRVRSRRRQAQTTAATANQVIDDGLALGDEGEDFTIPEDSFTLVEVLLLVKENGVADSTGIFKVSGTFYRDGAGATERVGSDVNTPNLKASLAGVSAELFIDGNDAVVVRVSPGAALNLDWRLVRTQTEGLPPP